MDEEINRLCWEMADLELQKEDWRFTYLEAYGRFKVEAYQIFNNLQEEIARKKEQKLQLEDESLKELINI